MKRIKRIDFYKKYTNEDRIPTFFGACISLIAILIIFGLVVFDLSKYLYPHVEHKVGLIQFPMNQRENTLPFNFDVEFDHVPCACTFSSNSSSSDDFTE